LTDRQNGTRAHTDQVISPVVWAGLMGTVQALLDKRRSAKFGAEVSMK
jgi:hypothetical protein